MGRPFIEFSANLERLLDAYKAGYLDEYMGYWAVVSRDVKLAVYTQEVNARRVFEKERSKDPEALIEQICASKE